MTDQPESPQPKPERMLTRKFTYGALLFLLLCNGGILALLAFGNSQWHQYIYRFQAYVWPKHEEGLIWPPKDYTGPWQVWDVNGYKWREANFKDGVLHGKHIMWYADGQKWLEENWKDGEQHGKQFKWWAGGQKDWERNYKDGKKHGMCTWYNQKGGIIAQGSYKDGKPFQGSFSDLAEPSQSDPVFDKKYEREHRIGHYKDGKPFEGSFIRWDSESKEYLIEHYKNGKLIRTEYPNQKKQPGAAK